MQPKQKKQALLYGGIGFVAIGAISIFAIYMTVYQPLLTQNKQFNLQEIHASPKLVMHDHAFLVLVKNGQKAEVPKDIGMPGGIWHDKSLEKYGPSGLSPMHTHDTSGTIHIESTSIREFTFGEFLDVWGIDTGSIVSVADSKGNEIKDYRDFVLAEGSILYMEISG